MVCRKNLRSGAVGGSMKFDVVNDDVLHLVKIWWRRGCGGIFKAMGNLRAGVSSGPSTLSYVKIASQR